MERKPIITEYDQVQDFMEGNRDTVLVDMEVIEDIGMDKLPEGAIIVEFEDGRGGASLAITTDKDKSDKLIEDVEEHGTRYAFGIFLGYPTEAVVWFRDTDPLDMMTMERYVLTWGTKSCVVPEELLHYSAVWIKEEYRVNPKVEPF